MFQDIQLPSEDGAFAGISLFYHIELDSILRFKTKVRSKLQNNTGVCLP